MTDLKITVDQIKNYIGTGLVIRVIRRGSFTTSPNDISFEEFSVLDFNVVFKRRYGVKEAKPVCYRLSDLDKEIVHNGEKFVPYTKIENDFDIEDLTSDLEYLVKREDDGNVFISLNKQMAIMQKLFEWHFWPFGNEYFEQGLIIDKRKETINE